MISCSVALVAWPRPRPLASSTNNANASVRFLGDLLQRNGTLALFEDPDVVERLPFRIGQLEPDGHDLAISGEHRRSGADDLAGLLECEGRTERIGSLDGLRVVIRRARKWVILAVVAAGPLRDLGLPVGLHQAVGVLHVLPACLVRARPALRRRAGAKGRLRHIELPSPDYETTKVSALRASSCRRQDHGEHSSEGEQVSLHGQLLVRINACWAPLSREAPERS